MEVDLNTLDDKSRYKLLMSSIVPRPIALVTSMGDNGVVNAAPFSLFNIMSANPPTVVLGIDGREPGVPKDTTRNIRETGEFVVNLVNEALAEKMNQCAAGLPYGTSEIEHAGLSTTPSTQVRPPRIAGSPINLECRCANMLDIGNDRTIIVGTILHYHIEDQYYDSEKQYVLSEKVGFIARMHGRSWYTRTTDLYEIFRPDVSRLG